MLLSTPVTLARIIDYSDYWWDEADVLRCLFQGIHTPLGDFAINPGCYRATENIIFCDFHFSARRLLLSSSSSTTTPNSCY